MMKKEKQLFIKTTDSETADELISLNFQLVSKEAGVWVFLNESKRLNFDSEKLKKVAYSNTLTI